MIHVVTQANQHLYPRQLEQMFRMRHTFYVEGHKWAGLVGRDGREVDEFDDEHAVYLMSLDPRGDLATSVRLNPTTGPTLLRKFSDWSDEPLPEGEDVWDISRWIASPEHRRGSNPRWPSNHPRQLMLGLLEFGLSRGLTRFTLLAELRLAERIAAYGWPIRHLGPPRSYEGGKGVAVAAEIRTGYHLLAMTRARTGLVSPVLVEVTPREDAGARTDTTHEVSGELVALIREIGAPLVRRFLKASADEIAQGFGADTPQATELAQTLLRLVDRCDPDLSHPAERPKASLPSPGATATTPISTGPRPA